MSRGALLALLALGCGNGPDRPDPTGGTTTGTPTGTPIPDGPHVRCKVQPDNVLRYDCDAVLPFDGPAEAYLELPDGSLRPVEAVQDGEALAFTVWRIRPETTYRVRVQPSSGAELSTELTTAPLPPEAALTPVVTGEASFDAVLIPLQCTGWPALFLVDTDGTVLWYQEVAEGMTGVNYTAIDGFHGDAEGVVAVVGHEKLRAWSWTGEPTLDLAWPGELPLPIHHDVLRRDGHLFVLSAEEYAALDGNRYVMDGVLVFDEAGQLVADWRLSEFYEPVGAFGDGGGFWGRIYPDAHDWAHLNGIEVDDAGRWVLSSKHYNTVFEVRGDWTAPDFGGTNWSMATDPASPFGSDFSFAGPDPNWFSDQHAPVYDGLGRLALFDNRGTAVEFSRATLWDVDTGSGVATLLQAWEVEQHCPVQGSAFPLENDHMVATCAPNRKVYEFMPGQAEPLWTLEAMCAEGTRALTIRGVPLSFD